MDTQGKEILADIVKELDGSYCADNIGAAHSDMEWLCDELRKAHELIQLALGTEVLEEAVAQAPKSRDTIGWAIRKFQHVLRRRIAK